MKHDEQPIRIDIVIVVVVGAMGNQYRLQSVSGTLHLEVLAKKITSKKAILSENSHPPSSNNSTQFWSKCCLFRVIFFEQICVGETSPTTMDYVIRLWGTQMYIFLTVMFK